MRTLQKMLSFSFLNFLEIQDVDILGHHQTPTKTCFLFRILRISLPQNNIHLLAFLIDISKMRFGILFVRSLGKVQNMSKSK